MAIFFKYILWDKYKWIVMWREKKKKTVPVLYSLLRETLLLEPEWPSRFLASKEV